MNVAKNCTQSKIGTKIEHYIFFQMFKNRAWYFLENVLKKNCVVSYLYEMHLFFSSTTITATTLLGVSLWFTPPTAIMTTTEATDLGAWGRPLGTTEGSPEESWTVKRRSLLAAMEVTWRVLTVTRASSQSPWDRQVNKNNALYYLLQTLVPQEFRHYYMYLSSPQHHSTIS